MRKMLVLVLVAGLAATLFAAAPALSKRKTVEVDDNYFVHRGAPSTVRVRKNDTVVWEWEGRTRAPHNVTVRRGPVKFHSSTKRSGTYRKKLTRRGTYRIVCTIHAPQMRMTLRVR
jgi:plastocyanin